MILKELLHSVDFRKVADAYKKLYPKNANDIVFLKCHYDILCNIVPKSDADSQVCRISMEYDDTVKKQYLAAYSLEGDLWSSSLCKVIEIEPDVKASLEEIAACCLWHTSFYGYTEEQLANTAEGFSNEWRDKSDLEIYQIKLVHNLTAIEQLCNYAHELPLLKDVYKVVKSRANEQNKIYKGRHIKKRIRNRWFRRDFIKTEYYRYLYDISRFILDVKTSKESMDGLCTSYSFKKFRVYDYRSYTYGKSDPTEYLRELVEKYGAFDTTYRHVYISIQSSKKYSGIKDLSHSEKSLCYAIISFCSDMGQYYISVKQDDSLGDELRIVVAFYEY